MQLAQLHMVKEILETGSLSKTATRLNWAQSVVSRQLAALERECGGRIFYRNGRGVALTELGERILPKIDLIITAAQDIVGCGSRLQNEIAGDVKIAVSPQILPFLSGPLFAELAEKYPNIRLSVWEAFTNGIKSDIQEGRTDIAVCMLSDSAITQDDRVICELDSYLVGRPDSPAVSGETIPFSQVTKLPLLLPSPPSVWRRMFEQVASSQGESLRIAAEVNAPGPMATLVHEGAGYLISPLVSGAAAARMGWIGADVHAKHLRASRIVEPEFPVKLVVSMGVHRHRRVDSVGRLIESILNELMKPDPDNDVAAPVYSAAVAPERRAAAG